MRKQIKRTDYLTGKTSNCRRRVRTAFVVALTIIASILILTQVRYPIVTGQELPPVTVGEVPLPVNVGAAGQALFQNGSADEIVTAREISLRVLNKLLRNRNVGTVSDLKVKKVEIDDLQMAHARVQQTFDGIPVWEGEAIVHLKSDGSFFAITDNLKEAISVNTKPDLSPDEAVRLAVGLYKGRAKQTETPKVELWIYRGDDRDYLAYRVQTMRIDGSNDPAMPVDFIDAHTGERVFGYDNLQHGTGSSLYSGTVSIGTSSVGSTFYMENLSRKVGTFDFNNTTMTGTAFRFADLDDFWNSSEQLAGVDAQYGAEATMNYYQTVHGRNGIDGSGGPGSFSAAANSSVGLISSFVHYGVGFNNSFWNGSFLSYGDGDGFNFLPWVTLDLCGHEITHGVTQFTANLTYAKESGALNESMSDVFGTMVERYVRPATWNWKFAEEAYIAGDALRYLDDPHANGLPDHYSLRLNPGACTPSESNDQCGVHSNSSISNHAFYLIAAGGTNRVSGITVPAIGPDNAAKIWYLALTSYMTSATDFAGARQATLEAATALFGASSSQYNSVATGWCAVGVGVCPGSGGTCAAAAITVGQTINGSLAAADCVFTGTTRHVDLYTFNGTSGQQIAVSMSSSTFDTYLYLANASNQLVAEDDDGGGGTNSRIPITSGFITLPATGTYTIYATSFASNSLGTYSLTLSGGGTCPAAAISVGQTINGSLTTSDCIYTGTNRYVDLYTFNGSAGQRLAVSMSSSSFDTYLYLLNSSNQIIGEDDDGGGGTNSRVPATSGFVTLPATGTYKIQATSFSAGFTGAYSISLIAGVAAPLAPTANAATSVTTSSFTANWSSSSGATGYRLDVSVSSTFSSFVSGFQNLDVGNVLSRSLTGLAASTNYFYRVRAYNVGGTSGNSGTVTVTTTTPIVTRTLTVASSNPTSGVNITVTPNDNSGLGNGTTQFTRTYNNNTSVSLTAPATVGVNTFQKWQRDGADLSTNRTTSLTMDANHTMTAVYLTPMLVQFSASTASVSEILNQTTRVNLTVTRAGTTSAAASVSYATGNGTASDRSDYLAALGTLNFAAGETSKTVSVFIVDDRFGEVPETFSVALSNPVGCTLGSPSTSTITINSNESVNGTNPVKDASFNSDFFVREHYVDFFNREADADGLAFWKNQIDSCTTQACREIRRINVSAAFFVSIEFQQTGYLVERLYKTAYGSALGTSTFGGAHQLSVPIVRLNEFLPDTQQIGRGVIIGQPGADQLLESNKQSLIAEFVLRSRFLTAYPLSMTSAQFVDKLNTNAGGALSASERNQLVSDLTLGIKTRAQVLRAVAEDADLFAAERNRAFVLAQYFGYLRRNPNDSPDSDYTGYDFWLGKLNQFSGNFVDAEMVKAFILSGEYQLRFGP